MGKDKIKKETPYNPLEKRNIGNNIIDALLSTEHKRMPPQPFVGAGVYALYYTGSYPLYACLQTEIPIYVGKAVPAGARKGLIRTDEDQGQMLYNRLKEHSESIEMSSNLELNDFTCRYLAVDDIWIPLAETLLIERFRPVWNVVVEGFGNHDPGSGRYNQQRSAWDTLHPGRLWASKLKPGRVSQEEIILNVERFLQGIHG